MRDLKASDKNEITIFDKQSGTQIKFFYKTPLTTDRIEYKSKLTKTAIENKNDINTAMAKVQLEFAEKFIVGFDEKTFGVDGKPISSNPESENYFAEWKKYLMDNAADLLFTFIDVVFDAPNYQVKNNVFF